MFFDPELKCQRIGKLTTENLNSRAKPQLVCNNKHLSDMHHGQKAGGMCEATFVASTVRPEALSVQVDVGDGHEKCQPTEMQQ